MLRSMIQRIRIEGYRSLKDVTWTPGKLNVVIGPNASGKSNLLRALALLHRSALGKLPEDILREGGMGSILWDGQVGSLGWSLTADRIEHGGTDEQLSVAYDLKLSRLGTTSAYRVENELVASHTKSGQVAKLLTREPLASRIEESPPYLYSHGSAWPEEQTTLSFMNSMTGHILLGVFREAWLGSWQIFQDLQVGQDSEIRKAAVSRLESRVATNGSNLVPFLHTLYSSNRDFKNDVDMSMRAAFGDDFEELSFPPAADQLVQLRLRWRSLKNDQSAASLSDGTLRFLLLVAILANPQPGKLIAIDEPETGSHPSMLPVVADLAYQAADRTQVVFSTHSPQFLDAFKTQTPTTTVAQWVDGETKLNVLDGAELERWLKEYSLGALFKSGELEGMA
jgi:predicted ATPase